LRRQALVSCNPSLARLGERLSPQAPVWCSAPEPQGNYGLLTAGVNDVRLTLLLFGETSICFLPLWKSRRSKDPVQTPDDFLNRARQVAQQLAVRPLEVSLAGDDEFLTAQLGQLRTIFSPARVLALLPELGRQATICLDRAPREAFSLALLAHQLACGEADAHSRADTGLVLATVLNRLGEFQAARALAAQVAAFFASCDESEAEARALWEAAWADSFIGDLGQALDRSARARTLYSTLPFPAYCDLIQARVMRAQADFPEAIALLQQTRGGFESAGLPVEGARCEREIASILTAMQSKGVLAHLEIARPVFHESGCVLDAAICDLILGSSLSTDGSHGPALQVVSVAREQLVDLGASYYVARADTLSGVAYRHLNRFEESRQALLRARDYNVSHGLRAEVSASDINLGSLYFVLNRYEEALALYEEARSLSQEDGREERAARIHINIGLIYVKQGRYGPALGSFHRALETATSKGLTRLAAGCHHGLGICYRELGQYAEALIHLQHCREWTVQNHVRESLMQDDIELAEIYLARGQTALALTCLEEARAYAREDGMDSYVAMCDRLCAQAAAPTSDRTSSLALVRNARRLFAKQSQEIDAALCDLTEGDLHLQWGELLPAQKHFRRAIKPLAGAFPDQAWRAEYGLGRCAVASGKTKAALRYHLQAVRTIATTRSSLVTEQLSNDFFAHRQSVFSEALALAVAQDATESALEVIEASKARSFLTLLERRGWKVRPEQQDAYVAGLIARERELSHHLELLRRRAAVQLSENWGQVFRPDTERSGASLPAAQELNGMNREYEAVVSQLRLASVGLAGVSAPAPFELTKFRRAANAAFGLDWAALDYNLADDTLTVAVVSPDRLETSCRTLSPFDQAALKKCTSSESDLREVIYRGTLRGTAVPSSGNESLRHLCSLLIPPDLQAMVLLVAPHGALHALPFHALVAEDNRYLVEHHTLVYTPSLQVLQALLGAKSRRAAPHPLVLGLSQFEGTARPLPFALAEMDGVHQLFEGRGQFWREEAATREKIQDLDLSGQLAQFDLIHFATHAVLDQTAPHQSRILLHDAALTALDVLDLSLDAQLVTLSACQTALGQGGQGDEWLGLTRAFFFAGAHALLATLWSVEDAAVVELIERFYRHWLDGENAAQALRQAQLEMIGAGYSPYQWAPFVLIGQP
jgi:tetratricopeptide (TPR) repeat protein